MNTLLQLGILLRSLESVEGRKKLQKIVHILQEFDVPFGVRYGYHHYGPFSEDLQDSLQRFAHDGLIKESGVPGAYPTYKFEPEVKLLNLLAALKISGEPPWSGFAKKLNAKSPRELESLSTLIYLEKTAQPGQSQDSMDAAFKDLKPALVDLLPKARTWLDEYRERFQPERLTP